MSRAPGFDQQAFRAAYGRFVLAHPERVLLTGHSHQAWPDVAREAMARAFDDAAETCDDKWAERVFPLVANVGRRVLSRLGLSEDDHLAFGSNTHELVYRLMSALPRDARVVTTTSEFHSLHRQLSRLSEDGLRVRWVDASDRARLPDRVLAELRQGADLLAMSAVLFEDSYVVPRLGEIAAEARALGVEVLIDAYHAFNVVPLDFGPRGDELFVTAGGYKYAQFGEGLCFLRSPRGTALRPRQTGWFADFAALERPRAAAGEAVGYGAGQRFAGATFDPTAFYRAAAVLDLFDRFGLDVRALRQISQGQTARIVERLSAAGVPLLSSLDPARRGGFVAARVPGAPELAKRLRARGVWVDARDQALRLGPAPYLLDEEIDRALDVVLAELGA